MPVEVCLEDVSSRWCARRRCWSDRSLLLAGAAAHHDAAVGADEQRSRLGHGNFLRRLSGRGARPRDPDRPHRHSSCIFRVGCTIAGHLLFMFADGFWSALATRALTGIGWAGTYDRPQAARGPGRCEAHVARGDRGTPPEHRRLRRTVLLHGRAPPPPVRGSARRSLRMALRFSRGR